MQTVIERPEKPIEQKKPRCPHCGSRPCQMFVNFVAFDGAPAAVICCANCEKIISVAPLMPPANAQPARHESSLILPTM